MRITSKRRQFVHAARVRAARLIIADDHGLFRQGLRQLLEAEGYLVEAEATSGDEALTAVAEHQGCVLLLDIARPGMDGLEVARRLAERGDDRTFEELRRAKRDKRRRGGAKAIGDCLSPEFAQPPGAAKSCEPASVAG